MVTYLKNILLNLANHLKSLILKMILQKKRHITVSLPFSVKKNKRQSVADSYFITKDNRKIPIYDDYRYKIKKGWQYFKPLRLFSYFKEKEILKDIEESFFISAIGTKTLGKNLSEISDTLKPIIAKNKGLFIEESLSNDIPILFTDLKNTDRIISKYFINLKNILRKVEMLNIYKFNKKMKLLEIGFTSGGYSLFAFEKLGFEVFGIDNYYDGLINEVKLPYYLKQKLNSKVDFCFGDIRKKNDFSDNFFDVIYSASVLEHIMGLRNCFKEMYRLLKPGGIMYHGYNPFFCPNGGHALGIPDSPWGHVRISKEEYIDYIKQFRPYEYDTAKDWLNNALNRISIQKMQQLLIEEGFDILLWQEMPAPDGQLKGLNQCIMQEAILNYKGLTIADLMSQHITVIAKKKI